MTAENTKINIINAAGELAAELGFDNVSTRLVADRSGENIGSIHYHFGGKDGLFEAVVREAMCGGCGLDDDHLKLVNETSSPIEFSRIIRTVVSAEITEMFRSDRPGWHVPVIYQLLQRDDALYDLFEVEVMQPSRQRMEHFYKLIQPDMDSEDIHLHKMLMMMPIYAHADYMKTMLKMLGADRYSDEYLQRMEDLIVKQSQLLLGLPLDK